MSENFVSAIKQLSKEKNLDPETVFIAVEAAMASAFKKDELQYANLEVSINKESGEIEITRLYAVMDDDDIEDDEIEVSPERASKMGHTKAKIGEEIKEKVIQNKNLGRIAAQTTKQVVLQRIREAERNTVHEEYSQQIGELVSGTIIRIDQSRNVIVDIGKAEGIIPQGEQIRNEHYRSGQRIKLYIKDVNKISKGPQIILSRKSSDLVKKLLEIEVPEISKGIIKIMAVSRIAGKRTKVALIANQIGIDPIGSVVGMRGSRIQNIINDLNGERIDLIRWEPNIAAYVTSALSPAEIVSVNIEEKTRTAFVAVPDKQLSLAIGRNGENATLAAYLTGYTIDLQGESALINAGEDLIPPPVPNLSAILEDEVLEVQALKSQDDTGALDENISAESEQQSQSARLTPEQEIIQQYTTPDQKDSIGLATNDNNDDKESTKEQSEKAGIRFAEEIRDVNRIDDPKKTKVKKRKAKRNSLDENSDEEEYSEYLDMFKED
ncbi:MAG: transcription termination factor NusA [Dehalococcoidia bacterium]|nr:transcription termination factor NusA [Dehalococcoidia bacterium]